MFDTEAGAEDVIEILEFANSQLLELRDYDRLLDQELDDIYRFAVEQTAMARGEILELAIVLILVFELVLFFAGVMR